MLNGKLWEILTPLCVAPCTLCLYCCLYGVRLFPVPLQMFTFASMWCVVTISPLVYLASVLCGVGGGTAVIALLGFCVTGPKGLVAQCWGGDLC